MMIMVEVKFKAVGKVIDGWKYGAVGYKHYDASFSITFDERKVNDGQVNQKIQESIKQFKQYHPTGQIINQSQRQF